jgi:NADPH:quinone reductase
MRAFAIDEFGAAGSIRQVPDPIAGDGQVRVRVEAAAVNPADIAMSAGMYKDFIEHRFPLILGGDLGGTVDQVGSGVEGLAVGDPVFGSQGKPIVGEGTFAEYVVAMPSNLARRPAAIDAAFGAAISLVGASALQMVDVVGPGPGDVVVLVGASGGIGSIAVQLVAAAGASPVAVGAAANHEYVRSLGASETIDYASQDVVEEIRAAHPDGVAAVLDMVGDKEGNARLGELVRSGGYLMSMLGGADVEALAAHGVTGVNVRTEVTTEKLERLAALVAAGTLRPPQIATFPLDETGKALTAVAGRHVRGKLVVIP